MNTTDPAQTTKKAPTIIEITADVEGYISGKEDSYYARTEIVFKIHSTRRFDRITFSHLGFQARSKGKSGIRFDGSWYIAGDDLEPNTSALAKITPFQLCLTNIGDSFMQVSVRFPDGVERCKMTILQEPKAPKEVDTFIEYEGTWYCTAVINCLQTIRIEEQPHD